MTDFGTTKERAAALKVCEVCKDLNTALLDAARLGVNIKIIDISKDWDSGSVLSIHRMERRTQILPTPLASVDAVADAVVS